MIRDLEDKLRVIHLTCLVKWQHSHFKRFQGEDFHWFARLRAVLLGFEDRQGVASKQHPSSVRFPTPTRADTIQPA